MSRKISLEAKVLYFITVPVVATLDVTMRGESDNSAVFQHVLENYLKGKRALLQADIENVKLEDLQIAEGESAHTFTIDGLWGNMQDIVSDNFEMLTGKLLDSKVTDSH